MKAAGADADVAYAVFSDPDGAAEEAAE